ncbi:MAG: hypothetical protein ACM3JD_01345, partial [Rudaea sp.]
QLDSFRKKAAGMTIFLLPKRPSRDKLAAMEPSATRPLLGRRIALELRPARPLTWIGPSWAAICGALASGGLALSGETFLRIAIAIILADPILGAWRSAWVNTDWRAPLRVWRPTPTRSWTLVPYARLDSPAARLSQWISSRGKFWNGAVWPEVGQAISSLVISGAVALTMALVLGTPAFLITSLALLLAPFETELGKHEAGSWARALAEISIAWLIGNAAFSLPGLESILLALFFAGAYRGLLATSNGRAVGFALANVFQVLVAAALVAGGALLNAAFVAFAIIGEMLWQAFARAQEADSGYLGRVQWFILAAMLVAAVGVQHL